MIVLKGYSLNTNQLAMVPAVRLAILIHPQPSKEGRRPSGGQQIPNLGPQRKLLPKR